MLRRFATVWLVFGGEMNEGAYSDQVLPLDHRMIGCLEMCRDYEAGSHPEMLTTGYYVMEVKFTKRRERMAWRRWLSHAAKDA